MASARVSVAQAACNSLADWLRQQMDPGVVISPIWVETSGQLPQKMISIVKVGKRSGLDVLPARYSETTVQVSPTVAQVAMTWGSYTQPVQLDVWAKYDADRDDMIAQLDEVLTGGADKTGAYPAGATDDPVRDGLLLPMRALDGFGGNVDFWFDEVEIYDSAESAARSEYRATYFGEARGVLTILKNVPVITRVSLGMTDANGQLLTTDTDVGD